MKTLILFASRYGATEEIAYMLKSAVGGDVTVCNVRERGISLAEYDTVIIGSCVYMFKLDKHIKRFLRRNEKALMGKRLGLYLCCYTTPGTDGYLEHFFSPELLAHAAAKDILGGKMQYEKMSYAYKQLFGALMTSPQYRAQYAEPQGRILMNPFKDVKASSWFGKYVIDLYNDGIINGTSATTYAPNDTLTWAAALKLLLVSNGDLKAADATGADWSKNAIAKAAELGLVAADLDGAKAISRLEFCQVAAKLNKLAESKTESKFTDCTDGYVMALVDAKVINGMTETTFEPAASLTRAQIAKIIYQLNLIEK